MATFGELNEELYRLVERVLAIPHLSDDLPMNYASALGSLGDACEQIHVTDSYLLDYEEED